MALLGTRKFLVHYGGKWAAGLHRYIGGKAVSLLDVDGDELCYIDLKKDIEEKTGLSGCRVQWVQDGALAFICNDVDILYMWGHIKAVKGVYHLYVEETSGPTKVTKTLSNKAPTTPTKKGIAKVNVKVRRSPRLVEKFRSKFTSKVPLVLSDSDEDEIVKESEAVKEGETVIEGEDVSKALIVVDQGEKEAAVFDNSNLFLKKVLCNIGHLDDGDDWAIRTLVQSTCDGIEDINWDWDIPTEHISDPTFTSQPPLNSDPTPTSVLPLNSDVTLNSKPSLNSDPTSHPDSPHYSDPTFQSDSPNSDSFQSDPVLNPNSPSTTESYLEDVIKQCEVLGFNSVNAEEQYHSGSDSEEDNEGLDDEEAGSGEEKKHDE